MTPASLLVIDTSVDGRDALARAVRAAGLVALAGATAAEGLALLTSLRPQLILLDVDGPGDDARDILRQVRIESADVPVIAVSRSADPAVVVRAMRAGCSDFLVKPIDPGRLADCVRGLLAVTEPVTSPGPPPPAPSADPLGIDLEMLFRGSPRMQSVEHIVRQAADTNATILLQGESGTGKEMIAKAIHAISGRRDRPFLKVNCASLPGDLLESELFGHERGAFTGAHRRKPGKFELAHRGTFLLDEIGEVPIALQAKLLHVLQDGTFFRVGGSELMTADVRLIAATNRDLASVVAAGLFREDLYYRLNVVTITVPPLRERREEIPGLVAHFLSKFCRQYEREAPRLSAESMRLLHEYAWPGNVRELENMIKRLVVLQDESLLREEIALRRSRPWPALSPPSTAQNTQREQQSSVPPPPSPGLLGAQVGLKEVARRAALEAEKAVLKEVLDRVRWNRAEAARVLKISYKALLYKISAAGLDSTLDRRPRGK